jgi:transketolase
MASVHADADPTQPRVRLGVTACMLSKGHACVAVYAALSECGFIEPAGELLSYGQDHSVLMNHVSHKATGVEFSTGSLGHGLPFGVGKALAAQAACGTDWRTLRAAG